MADDINDRLRTFLATEPGSLGLEAKIAEIRAENERLEAELDRVQKNRDAILREKRLLQDRPDKALRGTETEVFISAADARDPAEYRRMKEVAASQGKSLKIVADGAASTDDSPVKFVSDDDRGVLWINRRMIQEVGIARLREIAGEKKQQMQFFANLDGLPRHLHRKHFEIAHGDDRDARLEVG